jgi:hypothetical protein
MRRATGAHQDLEGGSLAGTLLKTKGGIAVGQVRRGAGRRGSPKNRSPRVASRPSQDQLEALLDMDVEVERLDLNDAGEVVAVCRRGRFRQRVPILDLPLPDPPPSGWEWIEAYRYWGWGRR